MSLEEINDLIESTPDFLENGYGKEAFKVNGMIMKVFPGDNDYYLACPKCRKKVMEEGGGFRCEKQCNEFFAKCDIIYMLKASFMDYSRSISVTLPRESG